MNFLRFCLCFVALAPLGLRAAEPPPVELFFKNAEFTNPQLSPDGKTIAMLAPINGHMNLVAMDLETRQLRGLTGETRDITSYGWVSDDRLFYGADSAEVTNDNQNVGGAIVAVNRDGSELEVVLPSWAERHAPGTSFGARRTIKGTVDVIHPLPDDPDTVLVTNNERRTAEPDVFLMDVHTGRLQKLFNNPGNVGQYYTTPEGEVLLGVGVDRDRDGALIVLKRDPESGEWTEIAEFERWDKADWSLEGVDRGGKRALVSARIDSDRARIYWMSLEDGSLSEPLLSDPVYDVGNENGGPLRGFKTRAIVGYRYDAAKPRTVYFHDQYAKLQELIDSAFPDTVNVIVSADRAGEAAVIRSFSDTKPPEYSLLYLKDLRLEPLFKAYPHLEDVELQPTRPITYEASDGRTIRGYLTLPASYRPGSPVPLILNPHGGPWARDNWGIRWWFDLEKQFLASRGFAVLQMDFRGSTGYGDDHYRSSFKRPDLMHQDVIDGAHWAIEEGYADPERLGIMGASWGGYATMTAVTKEPEMFNFGVNIFGVVDIPKQMARYQKMYGTKNDLYAYDTWVERMGDPDIPEERAMLEEWSAINFIDDLQAPVFIYHGLFDRNVNIEQSDILSSALRRKGWKEGEQFVVVKRTDEMHGMYNEANRIDLYQRIDAFLKPFAPAWND